MYAEFTLSGIPPSAAEDSSIRSRILLASQGVSRIETRQSYKGAGDPIYTPAHVKTLPSECLYHQICTAIGSLVSLSLWLSLPLRQKQPASRYKKRAMYNLIIVLSVDSDLHRFSAVTPGGLAPTSRILALPCSLLRTHQHLPGLCSSTRQSSFT